MIPLTRGTSTGKAGRKVVYERLWRMVSALKSGFAASAGVILFTLPIQLWFFYEIPVYSVLLNLLVLPFMSVVDGRGNPVIDPRS